MPKGPAASRSRRRRHDSIRIVALVLTTVIGTAAQTPPGDPTSRRVSQRIRDLQREAEQLAGQSRSVLAELRRLEVERDLHAEEAREAEEAAAAAQQRLAATADRIAALEQQREAQLPDIRAQLVDLYKRGRSGYAHLLFGAGSLREFARASRAIASLTAINERRAAEHRATIEALRSERQMLEQQARDLQARRESAQTARSAAQRAIAARTALMARIDSERDLAAQYAGELRVAYDRLQQQLASSDRSQVRVPLVPFRGALEWPVTGRVVSRFDDSGPEGPAGRHGIEIAVPEGSVVRAVHEGTVALAGPFTGFGTLVILDHGGNHFTLYGDLDAVLVDRGQPVEAGAQLGRTGQGPGTVPGLYFEVRIDGRSVDPLQWLKPLPQRSFVR